MLLWSFVFVVFVFLNVCECNSTIDFCPNIKTSISAMRKRRHLAFPENSNVVLTISLVKAFLTHAPSGWNLALEIDVLYPLPDEKFISLHSRRKLHHRQKRELWDTIQNALDFHNLNGRSCVIKSICEAKTSLAPPGKSLVHDLLRAIFTAPLYREEFVEEAVGEYKELLDPNFCDKVNDCPLSILDFVLALNKQKY